MSKFEEYMEKVTRFRSKPVDMDSNDELADKKNDDYSKILEKSSKYNKERDLKKDVKEKDSKKVKKITKKERKCNE